MAGDIEARAFFTWSSFRQGAGMTLAIGGSVFVYGLVFGIMARQASLSMLESLLMSGTVFAGASQFVVMDMWRHPLPVWPIILTCLVVNLRHILMGASLKPWYEGAPPAGAYGSLFFLCDEAWALSMSRMGDKDSNAGFLLGSGAVIYLSWLAATAVGRLLGSAMGDPGAWGLDFAFTAVFLALLVGMWRGKSDIPPWVAAAAVSILGAEFLPGKWNIIVGGLSGSIVGGLRNGD